MPEENDTDDELDLAYQRFGKRLKRKTIDQDPTEDPRLRAQLERIDAETPHQAKLFAEAETTLQKLKSDFLIALQPPTTLRELLIYLLAQHRTRTPSDTTLAAAALYTQLHNTSNFPGVSPKGFNKALKQLAKEQVLSLHEHEGTLLVRLHQEFLTDDEAVLLDLAARKQGTLSLEQAMILTKWPQARVTTALEALLAKKLLVLRKSYVHGTRYHLVEDS